MKQKEEKRKKELCAYVRQELEKRSRERSRFELQWQLNINFFMGNQYCDILPEAGRLYQQDKAFLWQEREVYNHIAPIVESRLAKLNRITPQVTVRPATGDEEDIQSAKVSTAILNSAFERIGMDALLAEAAVWSELCGTVFYKQSWVSNKGRIIGRNSGGRAVYEGDISTAVCPPYEIYPDTSYVQSIEKCASVIHAHVYSCDTIRNIWGKEVAPAEVKAFGFGSASAAGGLGYRAAVYAAAEETPKDSALVLEYYEQPSEEYEEGRYLVVCGDVLLFEGPLPYCNGDNGTRKLPFVQQNSICRPGCLWGVSIVERCIPIQRSYNAVRNRKHEFLNRAAVGILAVEEGTVDLEDLEENGLTPGKVLVYRQGTNPPAMLPAGSLPNEFSQEESALLEEFNLISGTSDLMRQSVAPTNVTSGVALNTIAEQDDTRLAITADRIRDAVLEISRQWLRLFKQFAGPLRLERIVGKNGEISKLYWSANMLTSDDVIHETENELSGSISNRKQLIYDLLAKGLFSDEGGVLSERTRVRLLRSLGLGDWENIADIGEVHTGRAQRENLLLKNGGEVRVLETDDHEIHISEHAKMLLSQEFEEEFGLSSEQHRRFEEHIAQHKMKTEAENHAEQ